MSLSIDGFWKSGFWSQTFWADGFWYEGAVTPPATPTPVAGGFSKRKPYPRKVMVRGQVYTVRSWAEELSLLQAALDRAEYQDAASVSPETAKPVQAIRRRLKRVESAHQKWLKRLREADEELLILLH